MQPTLAAYFMSDDSARLVESVRVAERAGYRRAWLNDAHTLWQDVYVHMTRVLDATATISVGSGVTNLVTRHFSVAASAHGTLAAIHPGRVVMGLGRGDAAVHTMGLPPMPTAEFARLTRLVRRLLRGEEVSAVAGEDRPFRIRWLEGDPVPIMIGATGPHNLRLAGGVADVVQLEVGVTDAAVRWGIEQVRAGAADAGRNPDEIEISIVCALWLADDRDEARARCRWAAASAANHIEEVMARGTAHGMPEEMTSVVAARRAAGHVHDYGTHLRGAAAAGDFLTDDLVDNFAIAGDAAHCRASLAALAELGVAEVASGFLNGELAQLRRVGAEVLAG
jgi:alkanesulfonate monooxygenase SsuD/methylene tetrahydromethanopterin reductase-like flavin-dependent oxidoreductase (luciferase family)